MIGCEYTRRGPRLNPCPKCGGKVEIIDLMSAFGITMIYCFHCNKRFNLIASDEKTLAKLWNNQFPKKEEK